MLIEQFGQMVDIDPAQARVECAIMRVLKRRGPTRQSFLFYHGGMRRYGVKSQLDPLYLNAIERLVRERLVLRSVQRKNGFLLRLPPRSMRTRLKQMEAA